MAHAFAALGVGVAGSVTTYYLVTRSGGDVMPDYILVSDDGTEKSNYTNKIGGENGMWLVAADNKKNEKWWEWSFNRWKADSEGEKTKDDLGAEFADKTKVKEGFENTSTTEPKTLNLVCKDIYGKDTTEIGSDDNGKGKRKISLWKYCSPLGAVPKTVNDVTDESYASDKLGESLKQSVLSVSSPDNTILWSLKNEKFAGKDLTESTSEKFFKHRYSDAKKGVKTLQSICEEAYGRDKSETSGDDTPTDTEVKKFCTLNGK